MKSPQTLAEFMTGAVASLRLTRVRGSSPRAAGTGMFVRADAVWGTIGGGQLEHIAIEAARDLLKHGLSSRHLDVPLGPGIGQCCGGRVEITLSRLSQADMDDAIVEAKQEDATRPVVYILGSGHVGRALADLFQHMPVRTVLVDQRAQELCQSEARVEKRQSALPEIDIQTAPARSAFIVLTHDHGLDFLLTSAALERGDAAYVGMIGSATKRAKFTRWSAKHNGDLPVAPLICPIGAGGSRDKRPAVIAAGVVAEVMAALTSESNADHPQKGTVWQVAAQ